MPVSYQPVADASNRISGKHDLYQAMSYTTNTQIHSS